NGGYVGGPSRTRVSTRACTVVAGLWMGAASLSGCVADRSNEHATVEMFSWWVESSEAAALRAILDLYRDEYPGVEVINAAAREATTARETLSTRFAQ